MGLRSDHQPARDTNEMPNAVMFGKGQSFRCKMTWTIGNYGGLAFIDCETRLTAKVIHNFQRRLI